jgi:hypothetical protein
MMKIEVEWVECMDKGHVWKIVKLPVTFTRNGNMMVKHNGKTYVFKKLEAGLPVFVLENGKWVKVGRISRDYHVFLGRENEMSFGEWSLTPEGKEALEKTLKEKW